jgi:hypothetical protein
MVIVVRTLYVAAYGAGVDWSSYVLLYYTRCVSRSSFVLPFVLLPFSFSLLYFTLLSLCISLLYRAVC